MGSVSNAELGQVTDDNLRTLAKAAFAAGIAAADPRRAVLDHLEWTPEGRLVIAGKPLRSKSELKIVAMGKAAATMASAVAEAVPAERFAGPGIAVVDAGGSAQVDRFRVLVAGHPVPDAAGVEAAAAVRRYLTGCREQDAVLALISGGASALLPAPPGDISLADKSATTRLLLACGAPIDEINCVRKHLSLLKGGGLARLAAPARVESLILSDVIGDDLGTVGSGPTAPDSSTFGDALRILERRRLIERLPPPVVARIERGLAGRVPETPKQDDPVFARVSNRLVGSNASSLAAVRNALEGEGFSIRLASPALRGEARQAAGFLAAATRRQWTGSGSLALVAGGETTVTVRGSGHGGRNQELALAFALAIEDHPLVGDWAFLSGGTDGRDGLTDAAGGLVDGGTLQRVRAAGHDPRAELECNNSYEALQGAGDLLVTGPTGTNVADLQIVLLRA